MIAPATYGTQRDRSAAWAPTPPRFGGDSSPALPAGRQRSADCKSEMRAKNSRIEGQRFSFSGSMQA